MPQSDAPHSRSIGLAGVVRWLIIVMGVVAIGAAFAAGFYGLAIVGTVFLVAAGGLAVRGARGKSGERVTLPPHDRP